MVLGVRFCRFLVAQLQPATVRLVGALVGILLVTTLVSLSDDAAATRRRPPLKPFLDAFRHSSIPRVVARDAEWPAAGGMQGGYLAYPLVEERLPAILLVSDKRGLHDWLKLSARELASVGYVVLAVDVTKLNDGTTPASRDAAPASNVLRERAIARLTAAVRWLNRQPFVDPERSGTVGLSEGAAWALAVAADKKLQACVTIDGPVNSDPVLLSGLRQTAILSICSGQHARSLGQQSRDSFRRELAARRIDCEFLLFERAEAGFLEPSRKSVYRFTDAERAWVHLYEFLGTHVEDAPVKDLLAAGHPARAAAIPDTASIADLMLAVNAPAGVRGRLLNLLDKPPSDARVWREVRAQAAVLVETAKLLERLGPHQGTRGDWRKHVSAYHTAATELLNAARRHDTATVKPALEHLNATCVACHQAHR